MRERIVKVGFWIGTVFTAIRTVIWWIGDIQTVQQLAEDRGAILSVLSRIALSGWTGPVIVVAALGFYLLVNRQPNRLMGGTNVPQRLRADIADALGERASDDELLKLFPDGFVVFDIDRQHQVFPYTTHVDLRKYRIDWSPVSLTTSGDRYHLCGPTVFIQGPLERSYTTALSGSLRNARKVLASGAPFASMAGSCHLGIGRNQTHHLMVYVCLLAFRQEGIIYAVGFKNQPMETFYAACADAGSASSTMS